MNALNMRIIGVYPHHNNYKSIDIFGYSSRGIPGVDIVGLGKRGRAIKEKFIYLTRIHGMKSPLKRYTLCIENEEDHKELSAKNYYWLELPLLVLFWSLSGHLPIGRLDDCFASGKVSISGRITVLPIPEDKLIQLKKKDITKGRILKYIAPVDVMVPSNILHFPLERIFEGKNYIDFGLQVSN